MSEYSGMTYSVFEVEGKWYYSVVHDDGSIETSYWQDRPDLEWSPYTPDEESAPTEQVAHYLAKMYIDMYQDEDREEK